MFARKLFVLLFTLFLSYGALVFGDGMGEALGVNLHAPDPTIAAGIGIFSAFAAMLSVVCGGTLLVLSVVYKDCDWIVIALGVVTCLGTAYLFGFFAGPIAEGEGLSCLWRSKFAILLLVNLFVWGYLLVGVCIDKFGHRDAVA